MPTRRLPRALGRAHPGRSAGCQCGAAPASGQATGGPRYQIYGVRFAGYHAFPVAELVAGADTARRTDLAFVVWVLKGSGPGATGHTVLFDAGFYRDQFIKAWKPFDFVRPSEAIGRVGVRAEDVTDVIISHVHWDHVDGVDLFPHARVWLQRAEYEHYVGDDGRPLARESIPSTPRCSRHYTVPDAST